MRLRLFERLRRLAGWPAGSRAQGRGWRRDSGPREDAGRHRRSAGPSRLPGPTPPQANGWTGSAPGAQAPGNYTTGLAGAGSGRPAAGAGGPAAGAGWPAPGGRPAPGDGRPVADGRPGAGGGGVGRARIREAPYGAAPVESVAVGHELQQADGSAPGVAVPRQPWYQVVGEPVGLARQPAGGGPESVARAAARTTRSARGGALPFAPPHRLGLPPAADGRRNCGALEAILWRQWDAATLPPPEVVEAIDRLAELPRQLQEKLAARLDGIYVGAGGVPDLDDMSALHGVPLPAGRATWDACAGAYGERKIVVGSRPSPTPDVMCHEVGHALDDIDSPPGKWQSDSAEFRMIYDQCQSFIASDFHRQRGGLGRKEFFADAFAAIASAQRPALVDMLSGNTRMALRVMLYFNRRYGI